MIINMQSGGVVPERILDAQTITPSTVNQVFEEGTYFRGALTILGDADLLAKNIPEDVNLFGIQGTRPSNFGANVWSRHDKKPNQTVALSVTFVNSGFQISTGNTDFTHADVTNEILDGLRVILKYDTSTYMYFDFYANGTYKLTYNDGSTTIKNYTYNQSTGIIGGIGYTPGSWSISGVSGNNRSIPYTTYGYIVSNDSTAYPSNGTHTDGYYYELLAQVSSTNAASLSDTALMTVQQDYRDTLEEEVSNANA